MERSQPPIGMTPIIDCGQRQAPSCHLSLYLFLFLRSQRWRMTTETRNNGTDNGDDDQKWEERRSSLISYRTYHPWLSPKSGILWFYDLTLTWGERNRGLMGRFAFSSSIYPHPSMLQTWVFYVSSSYAPSIGLLEERLIIFCDLCCQPNPSLPSTLHPLLCFLAFMLSA